MAVCKTGGSTTSPGGPFAEAYFWLDLATSGKPKTTSQQEIAKARDTSASRLTPAVLLQLNNERESGLRFIHPVRIRSESPSSDN
jgi:hypothetical protein